MKQYRDLHSALPAFKCLSSDIRIEILDLLIKNGTMRISDIAKELFVTNGTVSPHIKTLEKNGFITVHSLPGKHGIQHVCKIKDIGLLVDPDYSASSSGIYESEINIGHYSGYEIHPTCGLASSDHIIGREDDPRAFSSPERVNSEILWLSYGYVEYLIPNQLQDHNQITELQISLEVSSEAPGYCENWPSDISFFLNGLQLYTWTCPGDFGDISGMNTPLWWPRNWNQYGKLKVFSVNNAGTFESGKKRSDVSLEQLAIRKETPLTFRIAVKKDAVNQGGLTIYGKSFGNYPQNIRIRMKYENITSKE